MHEKDIRDAKPCNLVIYPLCFRSDLPAVTAHPSSKADSGFLWASFGCPRQWYADYIMARHYWSNYGSERRKSGDGREDFSQKSQVSGQPIEAAFGCAWYRQQVDEKRKLLDRDVQQRNIESDSSFPSRASILFEDVLYNPGLVHHGFGIQWARSSQTTGLEGHPPQTVEQRSKKQILLCRLSQHAILSAHCNLSRDRLFLEIFQCKIPGERFIVALTITRNTKETRLRLARDSTLLLLNGSSVTLTKLAICFTNESTCHIHSPRGTWSSSQESSLSSSLGLWHLYQGLLSLCSLLHHC